MPAGTSIASIAWSAALFWARFGINACVFLVIARWIPAEEVGAYGAAFAIVQILQAIQTSGLPEAVITTDQEHETDTAFWLSVTQGIAFGAAMFLLAPLADVLLGPHGPRYLQALAVVPVMIGVGAVSEATLRRQLQMRALTTRTTCSLLAAGTLAVALAWLGHGGWALVMLTLLNNGLSSLMNLLLAPWRPSLRFDTGLVPRLLRTAFSISARNVVKSSINPAIQFIVTAVLGAAAGGLYLIGVRFVSILSSLSMMPAQYAALPLFNRVKGDPLRRAGALLNAAAVMSVLSAPIYVGTSALAPFLLPALLGGQGGLVAPVVQGMLLHSPVLVLTNLAVPALVSMNMASRVLALTAGQMVLTVAVAAVASRTSLAAVGWSYAVAYSLLLPAFLVALRQAFAVPAAQLAAAVFRPWVAAMLAGVCAFATAWAAHRQSVAPWLGLAAGAGTGLLVYLLLLPVVARPQAQATVNLLLRPMLARLRSVRTSGAE